MSGSRGRAQTIFLNAVEMLGNDERMAYVVSECSEDVGLRREVEELLEHAQRLGRFMEGDGELGIATGLRAVPESAGDTIGPYKLLQQIGEGGMGDVYMAEQTEPVERRVALKLIKPGMDSRQVIARFEAERQALAMMDHPHIAKVLDAGTTQSGRPYFVMELVKGLPITQYSDKWQLTPRERLELFMPVCQAVQHAHQKGVIHRDLKPSNILVARYDDKAVPKIIDFGVAKAVSQRLTDKTVFTQFGQVMGTIDYMSPEQAQFNQLDVDTRSDIYSLGVLLYELLTGETPYDKERLRSEAFDDVLRIVREEEPPAPSTRLNDSRTLPAIADARRTEPKKLRSLIRGELDLIVMKSLEKDRGRRYDTAAGLADDIARFLNDEPIEACPASAAYRIAKFGRRNRRAVAVAAFVLFAFLLSGFSFGWMLRDRAARNAVIAAEVREVVGAIGHLEEQSRWGEALSRAEYAASLVKSSGGDDSLNAQVERYQRDLTLLVELEAIRLDQIRVVFDENRFDLEGARPRYRHAFKNWGIERSKTEPELVAEQTHMSSPPVQLAILAGLYSWQSIAPPQEKHWIGESLKALDLDTWRRNVHGALGNTSPQPLLQLANDKKVMAQPPALISIVADGLMGRGFFGETDRLLEVARREYPDDFWIMFQSGLASEGIGNLQHAARHYSAAHALRPNVVTAVALGSVVRRLGEPNLAADIYRNAVEIEPEYTKGHYNLGNALLDLGEYDEAIEALEESLRLAPGYCRAWFRLGEAYRRSGRPGDALDAYQRAVELEGQQNLLPHEQLGTVRLNRLYEIARHLEAAQPQYNEEFSQLADAVLQASEGDLEVAFQHAAELLLAGNEGGYRDFCRVAVSRFSETRNPRSANLLARMCTLGPDSGVDPGRIEQLAQRALDHAVGPNRLHTLGLAHYRSGRLPEAAAQFRQALDPTWVAHGVSHLGLALSDRKSGEVVSSERWYQEALHWLRSDPLNIDSHLHPHDRAECRLLLREHDSLVQNAGDRESDTDEESHTETADVR